MKNIGFKFHIPGILMSKKENIHMFVMITRIIHKRHTHSEKKSKSGTEQRSSSGGWGGGEGLYNLINKLYRIAFRLEVIPNLQSRL